MRDKFTVTKTYGHERGLSVCFRQWKAASHCRFLHGYALQFAFEFECSAEHLSKEGWVIDFGRLGPLYLALTQNFDHTMIVAADDPEREAMLLLEKAGLAKVVICEYGASCEGMSRMAYDLAYRVLFKEAIVGLPKHVRIARVTVSEHGSNSATYLPGEPEETDLDSAAARAAMAL